MGRSRALREVQRDTFMSGKIFTRTPSGGKVPVEVRKIPGRPGHTTTAPKDSIDHGASGDAFKN